MNKLPIFLFIFLIPLASAQLVALGDTTIQGTPCDATNSTLTLQNTGQTEQTYSISVDGSGSDFVAFSALNFVLQPGQSAPITTFYTIPCTTRPGTYDLDIFFSDGNQDLVLSQDIIVSIPDNINLTITPQSQVIPPCDTATYDITLTNPLSFNEIYHFNAEGHPNVHISQEQTILEAHSSKDMTLSVTPNDCTQSGNYPLSLTVEAEKSQQQEQYLLELLITASDIPVLANGITNIRTDYTDSTAELTIRNTGDRITAYTLTTQGPPWASVNPSSVSLNPGETQTVLLRFAPEQNVPRGTYPVTFSATVDATGIVYSKDLTVKLGPPTLLETNPALFVALIILGIAVLIGLFFLVKYIRSPAFDAKRKAYRAKIEAWKKKREQRKQQRQKRKEQKIAKKLEQKRKILERKQKAQERLEKKAERKVTKELKKSHYLISRKDTITGKQKRSFLRIATLVLAVLVLLLIINAWDLIAPNLASVGVGIAVLAIIFIAKKLARNRVIHAKWKLLLAKHPVTVNAWKQGLSQLHITSKDPIEQFKLLIRKTKTQTKPSPAVYQTFTIKTNADVDLAATFSVDKRWLARHNVDIDSVRLVRHTKNRWTNVPLKEIGHDDKQGHYSADLKPGTYSLYVKPGKPSEQKLKRNIIIGVAALAAIIILSVALAPEPQTIAHGIPPQTWSQDLVHKLDISPYFDDPDGDALKYNITETQHISVEITGSTAYFTPQTGWTGEERVRFIADDGKGGKITSNVVPLRVQQRVIPASWQPYIAIILAIAAILLLLWTVKQLQNKR